MPNESEVLITITARRDPGYPGRLLLSLRRYELNVDDPPTEVFQTVSIDDAVRVVHDWIQLVSESDSWS